MTVLALVYLLLALLLLFFPCSCAIRWPGLAQRATSIEHGAQLSGDSPAEGRGGRLVY
ncbi:MAG: hypothetical protein WKG07_01525 [Hymenobacter sp.]